MSAKAVRPDGLQHNTGYHKIVRKDLNERGQHLLKVLIEKYIEDGEPVGSRFLARESGLDLSPATIRNVMSDLEALGLIESPHTSAGRVPTVRGLRLFVDSLVTVRPLKNKEIERLKLQIGKDHNPQAMLKNVSDLLSGLTHMAGIITVPRREHTSLKHVEFLPLSDNRILAILVFNECDVQNRVLQTRRSYSQSELQQTANYLNAAFAGRDVYEVRRALISELKQAREHVTQLMGELIGMSDNLFPEPKEEDFVLAGETNLLSFSDISDNLERLRQLFEIFNKKQGILQILDHCLYSNGVQIFIGSESGHQILGECSIVTSPYKVDDKVVGVLGVIGPTRMAYERVIPIVDITAKLLGAALDFRN